MTDNRSTVRNFAWIALLSTGLMLQACAPTDSGAAGSRLRMFAADFSGGAKACEVPKVAPANDQTIDAEVKVTNDGGWCGLPVHQPGPKPFGAGLLSVRPAHGTAVIHQVGDDTRIDYTPDRGFAGTDSFTVKLLPGKASIHVVAAVAAPVK
jgi:Big-like domain-containing protein